VVLGGCGGGGLVWFGGWGGGGGGCCLLSETRALCFFFLGAIRGKGDRFGWVEGAIMEEDVLMGGATNPTDNLPPMFRRKAGKIKNSSVASFVIVV